MHKYDHLSEFYIQFWEIQELLKCAHCTKQPVRCCVSWLYLLTDTESTLMALLRPSLFLTPRLHVERGAGYRYYSVFWVGSKKSLKELGCNLLHAKHVLLGVAYFIINFQETITLIFIKLGFFFSNVQLLRHYSTQKLGIFQRKFKLIMLNQERFEFQLFQWYCTYFSTKSWMPQLLEYYYCKFWYWTDNYSISL